ncbi:MAG TPA: GAF domain-containing protein, partial [Thermoanaerobaculia bacterium]|nr:GAF domain-containing protein [Thermoanaerobaculia bacterium]
MTIPIHPPQRPQPWSPEERYRFLSAILESFAGTLDLDEVLRRIVNITLEQFGADRVLLIHPVTEEDGASTVRYAVHAPRVPAGFETGMPLQLSRRGIARALQTPSPVVLDETDPDIDIEMWKRFSIRSALMQILRPGDSEPWAFVLHQSSDRRKWTDEEISLFAEIGRYATLALNNTLLHARAVREIAKASAILDQIPEPAAIYDESGKLERMNAAALREASQLLGSAEPEGRLRLAQHRYIDGAGIDRDDLPSMRALRGEEVDADYVVRDAKSNEDRIVNMKAAAIRDAAGNIIGSVVLSRDITEERQNAEREQVRRRRAEALANLALDPLILQTNFEDLDGPAQRIAHALGGTVRLYLYRPSGLLELAGYCGTPETEEFREYFARSPYRPGEGLIGTAFQIGRPLFFYDIRGNDILDFARDDEERAVKSTMRERSLIAAPIESYGDRVGSLVVSQSDPRRKFDAEDLEFAQAVAERIGSAAHIHRLTRMSLDGHRAAEDLARREVDARVRFEAVLETAPIGIAAISPDELRFELANARFTDFAQQFGKISADTRLLGLRVDEVIPDLDAVVRHAAESGDTRIDEELEVRAGSRSRYINRIVSAVRGRFSGTTQSITVLVQDVTDQVSEERVSRDRESRRRRHAECLAKIGIETVTLEPALEQLDEPARRIAEAIGGSALIYLYSRSTGELHMVGMHSPLAAVHRFREYLARNPYHAGEGIPGTVFQIGRPLFFSDVRG